MRNLAGQVIKGYELNQLIGMGGFAAVYRAYQPAVDREVAIKVVLPKYANAPEFVRRFEAEAQLIARLEHIHIVPLYDYWREPNNAYLVMRWLRGGSLYDSLAAHGAWGVAETARLLDQMAGALLIAHRKGVIHQDLTPANILLDEDSNAFLADFGIAKELLKEADDGDRTLFGSPAYMAPEQILGRGVSPQTDIYSLGIVIYQTLTGRVPFDDPSHTEVMKQQVNAPLPPLQLYRPELPYSLNMVMMQATSKNPTLRYRDTIGMASAFRQAMQLSGVVDVLPTTAAVSGDLAVWPQEEPSDGPPVAVGEITTRDFSGQISTLHLDTVRPGATDDQPDQPVAGPMEPPPTLVLEPKLATIDFDQLLAPENPYKGLRAFEEADAVDFFGRDALIERLIQRLQDPSGGRFLAVVGPSGSGKSSVVKAGLLPALHQGRLPGSDRWFVAKMVPGAQPFRELSAALLSVAVEATDVSETLLRSSVRGLLRASSRLLGEDETTSLLLVIDQFEEVFTLTEDETERKLFLGSLLNAVNAPESRLRVIVTLRADFYDRPLLYPEFGELVRQHTEVVLPLAPDELHFAVTGPAERVGLTIEPGLVDAIVSDVSEQPGTLPLLQYALTELFTQRDDRTLTLAAYRASGGVRGALARRAEETYTALDDTQKGMLRQALLRLVSLGEGSEDTRRRARWSELMALGHDQRDVMQSVLDLFGQHRLFTFDRDPQTREPTVEVAHEALIREWRSLRAWLDESRDDLRMQRRLAASVGDWLNSGRDSSFLATGARLVQFEALATGTRLSLTEQERAYVQASIAQRQRAVRRVRLFVTALVVISVLAVVSALVAMSLQRVARDRQRVAEAERDRADEQARIAQSGALAVNALKNVDQGVIDVALLLSLEAFRAADTFEARNSLLTGVQAAPQLAAYLYGHSAPVRSAVFNPAGTMIASGSRDGMIQLWNVATRQRIGESLDHGARVYTVAFSPDGTRLASAGSSGAIRLWDVATGQAIGDPWVGHEDEVWRVAFSPDGKMLVSASFDGTLRRWDAVTGQPIGEPMTGHEDAVYSVAFSPDGTRLASASADFTIRLWDAATGQPVGEPIQAHNNWVLSVAFSPDGQMLASGSADNTARIWLVDTGEPLGETLSGHSDWVWSVAFSPDGRWLLTGSADSTAALWSLETGRVVARFAAHTNGVWDAEFSSDGRTVVTASEDSTLLLWDIMSAYPLLGRLTGHTNPIWSIAVSPENVPGGRFIVTGSGQNNGGGDDTTIRLWDAGTGTPRAVLNGHTSQVRAVAISPDGQTLASAGAGGEIIIWDVGSGTMRFSPLEGHVSHVNSVAFSPDGLTLASAGGDGLIQLWDIQAGTSIGSALAGHEGEIYSVAFSPDGRWLASGGLDSTVRLWDLGANPPASVVLNHRDRVMSVAFSPNSRLLATGSHDNTVSLWDVAAQRAVYMSLAGHTNYVSSVAFSPDGQMLASGSWDATIILWDVATGRALGKPLAGHNETVSAVAFSPDGLTLVSGSWDMAVDIWSVSLDDWRNRACLEANRNLTEREWSQYLGTATYRPTCTQINEPVG